jgi:Helix-turn-helix of DDE superfamily endonuclease
MTWEKISKLQGKKFRRYTGIYRSVYEEMLDCVKRIKTNRRKHPTKGVESALSIEDQVLITVMYWREYRDQYHLAVDFGISQTTVSRTITEIENILLKSGQFSIPGHKSLQMPNGAYEVVIVDVTETPTQRPKKNKSANIVAKRNDTL